MMNKILFLLICFPLFVFAQENTQTEQKELTKNEKQIALLRELGKKMILEKEFEDRRDANYAFIKQFTRLLKQDDSYNISLDDLSFISVQKPADDAFRIFTWQIETVPGLTRHFGAIQINQKKLKLIPLTDRSDDIENPELFTGNSRNWFGSIYYKVQSVKSKNGTKYYLYGFDSHNPISNKKLIDVLQFTNDGDVVFGLNVFPDIKRPGNTATRFIIEYREDAGVKLNYSPNEKKIIFDHLVPMSEASEGIFADYVPDGSFDALVMKNGLFYIESDVVSTTTIDLENQPQQNKSDTIYNPN